MSTPNPQDAAQPQASENPSQQPQGSGCHCGCGRWSRRLHELGLRLPAVPQPVAAYIPATQVGTQVWTSGQLPFVSGELPATGKVGAEVDLETAQQCAEQAAINAVAAAASVVGLESITRVLKVTVFVSSAVDFVDQALVANGASKLIEKVFGDAGTHVRSAVGAAVLPLNSPVEVELVVDTAA